MSEVGFREIGLNKQLQATMDQLGFTTPTEIQKRAIPKLLEGPIDFVGQAQTGTGKTAAFALPLLQTIDPKVRRVQALVLVPTRELANQVEAEFVKFSKGLGIVSQVICGGKGYDKQLSGLKKNVPHIVVGTPGRLIDLIKRKALNLSSSSHAILDEADEMLKMGFLEDVKFILSQFTKERTTWMFSATMPPPVLKLIKEELNNPIVEKVTGEKMSATNVEQKYYVVLNKNKREALCRELDSTENFYGMVFCNTRRETIEVSEFLINRGYRAESLHGDLNQNQREIAMDRFRARRAQVLVCTDVAARGIDVVELTHVINYGLPKEITSYVHRIGRTGRAGAKGIALSIIQPNEYGLIVRLERVTNCKIEHSRLASGDQLKSLLVNRHLKYIDKFGQSIRAHEDEFRVDGTYDDFAKLFEGLSKEACLKVMFSYEFCNELKRIDQMGSIDLVNFKKDIKSASFGDGRRRGRFGKNRSRSSSPRRSGDSGAKSESKGGGGGGAPRNRKRKRNKSESQGKSW